MQTILNSYNQHLNECDNSDDELDYFANTSDVIEQYYEIENKRKLTRINKPMYFNLLKRTTDMIDKKINDNTDVKDIYWIDNINKNNISKEKIIKNFNNIVNNKPLYDYYHFDKCIYCGNEMCINNNDGLIICDKCGNTEKILIESEVPSYKDNGGDKPIYPYKRLNHFMECINQFQAKENINIPNEVYEKIIEIFKKRKIKNLKILKLSDIRDVLKNLKMNKYYEHVSFIYSKITGNPPPRLTYNEENKLKKLFKQVDKSFIKFCPKDRSNFFNYNYLLHKLFKIMNMEKYLEYFPLLKSKEKLIKQEEIWKLVCSDIGIKYMSD